MVNPHNDAIHQRGRAMEEAFFADRDKQLLDNLRRRLTMEEAQKVLGAATGAMESIPLPELAGVAAPQFLAILGVFPMVDVAWCDKEVSHAERRAVLDAAHEMGIERGSACHQLLDRWLETRPAENVEKLWVEYVQAVCAAIDPVTVAKLKSGVMNRAEKIAAASGGILGIGNRISAAERACLDRLAEAFAPPAQTG